MKGISAAAVIVASSLLPVVGNAATAIAFDPNTGAYGYAYAKSSDEIAIKSAKERCAIRSSSCTEITVTNSNGYSAIVKGHKNSHFAVAKATDDMAKTEAMNACYSADSNCVLHVIFRDYAIEKQPTTAKQLTITE